VIVWAPVEVPGEPRSPLMAEPEVEAEEARFGNERRNAVPSAAAVIPPKANLRNPRDYDRDLSKAHHLLETSWQISSSCDISAK